MDDVALHHATDDVQAAFDWLINNGFAVSSSRGGSGASFGNQAIDLSDGANLFSFTRDRGQWTLHIQPAGWERRYGLDEMIAEMQGTPAARSRGTSGAVPTQHPAGVAWSARVAEIVDWIRPPTGR